MTLFLIRTKGKFTINMEPKALNPMAQVKLH